MRSLTREEAKALGRRAQQPEKAPGELLAVFVPGRLRNPLNGLKHWRAEKRYRREWHDAVALALLEAKWSEVRTGLCRDVSLFTDCPSHRCPWDHVPYIPKRITVIAQTHNTMDRDGLYASLKPAIDALTRSGVIHDDAEPVNGVGHEIECYQRIDRTHRGVKIRVRLKADAPQARDVAGQGGQG